MGGFSQRREGAKAAKNERSMKLPVRKSGKEVQ